MARERFTKCWVLPTGQESKNEKIYGKEEAELGKMYLDECMKRLDAALAKVR